LQHIEGKGDYNQETKRQIVVRKRSRIIVYNKQGENDREGSG
jgi:hypothetical protein